MVIQTMVTTKAVTTATWTVGFSTMTRSFRERPLRRAAHGVVRNSRSRLSINSGKATGGLRARAAGWAITRRAYSWATRACFRLWVITPTTSGSGGKSSIRTMWRDARPVTWVAVTFRTPDGHGPGTCTTY